MDLSRYDTREKAHEGVDIPLVINGETVYGDDDKPVTFRMRGLADPEVHKLVLQGRRAGSRTPDEVLQADLKLARASCQGWSDNWMHEGEKLPFNRKNVDRIFSVPLIRRNILAEVAEDAHFMNGPSDRPGSTSDNSPG